MARLVPSHLLVAAAVALVVAGPALACLQHVPERILGFQRGSATRAPEHLAMIREALHTPIDPTAYRVEVRGYADDCGPTPTPAAPAAPPAAAPAT